MAGPGEDEIQVISTDHCSFTLAQKAIGREDFSLIPNGLPGIEHRPQLIYGLGVARASSPQPDVRPAQRNPARIFGLYPRKGSLQVGADGDLVIWDPAVSRPFPPGISTSMWTTPLRGLQITGPGPAGYAPGPGWCRTRGDVTENSSGIYLPREGKKIGGNLKIFRFPS